VCRWKTKRRWSWSRNGAARLREGTAIGIGYVCRQQAGNIVIEVLESDNSVSAFSDIRASATRDDLLAREDARISTIGERLTRRREAAG
jgi:hypothetical protein